jgi:plasmid stabilization system protein ParE
MLLRWTTPAANDLYNIVQRIRRDNPAAATKVAKILYDECGHLRDFPCRGRKRRIEGTRELCSPDCLALLCTQFKIKS